MQKKNLHNYGDIVTTTKFQLTTIEAVVVSSHGAYYYSLMDDQEGILRNEKDRKSTRLNSSHIPLSRMPSSA